MKKIIIALCGKKQVGKSTSYELIKKINNNKKTIEKLSFASKLKEMVTNIFDVDYNKLIGSDEEKDSFTYLDWEDVDLSIREDFMNKDDLAPSIGKITHRELLQLVATNLFRAVRPNIWVECLQRSLAKSSSDIVVIDDARFPNELEALKNHKAILVKLYRNTGSLNSANHFSEIASDHLLDDYYDFVIHDHKNRTMEELENSWKKIMGFLGEKK